MAMRLLKKSEVEKKKVQEQAQTVQEGLKLARKVDNLREIAASEEQSLEKFRYATVENIHKEIEKETLRWNEMRKQADDAEYRREKALEPLTEAWKELQLKQHELEAAQKINRGNLEEIKQREERVAAAEKVSKTVIGWLQAKERRIDDNLHEAKLAYETAQSHRDTAALVESQARMAAKAISEDITTRQKAILAREESATMKEKEQAAEKVRISKEWLVLRDREAMLERDIKRLKKSQ